MSVVGGRVGFTMTSITDLPTLDGCGDPAAVLAYARAEKRVEEFKRMNQRLTETMQKAQDKRDEQGKSDVNRRVQNMERQWNDTKKSLEKAEKKLKETIESESKLKIELGKAQEEARKLKQTVARQQAAAGDAAKGGPGDGSGPGGASGSHAA